MLDDRQAYVLNSLLERHYSMGRIVRFRHARRGRQARCHELLTAGHGSFTLYLFPPPHDADRIEYACKCMDILADKSLPLAAPVAARDGRFVVAGPDRASMVVTASPAGQAISAEQWSLQDISMLGLRLAWLHESMEANCPDDAPPSLASRLERIADADPRSGKPGQPPAAALAALPGLVAALRRIEAARLPPRQWRHGDLSTNAVLVDGDRQIQSFVDFGRIGTGHRLEDALDVLAHWCMRERGILREEAARTFLSAYRSLLKRDPEPWSDAVHVWAARHIIDEARGLAPSPPFMDTIVMDLAGLAGALDATEGI